MSMNFTKFDFETKKIWALDFFLLNKKTIRKKYAERDEQKKIRLKTRPEEHESLPAKFILSDGSFDAMVPLEMVIKLKGNIASGHFTQPNRCLNKFNLLRLRS